MRSILVTVMLISVAVLIYISTIGGESGTKRKVLESGETVNRAIEKMNP